jgi:two-component system, LytTR family, sensor histidine kinase AlgZ
MRGSTNLAVPAPDAELLPRELAWFCLLAPVPAAFLLVYDLPTKPLAVIARKIGAVYVPFLAISGAIALTYLFVMPRVLSRLNTRPARWALHLLVIALVAVVISWLIRPFHNSLCGFDVPWSSFAVTSVAISYIMTLPAVAIQDTRNRAHAVEQFAMATRQAALRAQLEALQARTNPHFFFNSINTVASLIPDDPALAERTLERLADLFRYALDSAKTPRVPLSREFEMVREFLAIEGARFGDRLRATVTLDPAAADLMVPPLLLQPLVENAILHGLSQREGGRVEVSARREGDRILIDVRDDGPGPGASPHRGTQTSVRDLLERVLLGFGERGQFVLEEAPGGGCLARLALPCP